MRRDIGTLPTARHVAHGSNHDLAHRAGYGCVRVRRGRAPTSVRSSVVPLRDRSTATDRSNHDRSRSLSSPGRTTASGRRDEVPGRGGRVDRSESLSRPTPQWRRETKKTCLED